MMKYYLMLLYMVVGNALYASECKPIPSICDPYKIFYEEDRVSFCAINWRAGTVFFNCGDFKSAEPYYEAIVVADNQPLRAAALVRLGEIAMGMRYERTKKAQAKEYFQQAVELPGNPLARAAGLYWLAFLEFESGKLAVAYNHLEDAQREFRALIETHPRRVLSGYVRYYLGEIALLKKDSKGAQAYFEELRREPIDQWLLAWASLRLAEISLHEEGYVDKVFCDLEMVTQQDDHYVAQTLAFFSLGRIYQSLKNYEKAVYCFQHVVSQTTRVDLHGEAYLALAKMHQEGGHGLPEECQEEALMHFKRAAEPSHDPFSIACASFDLAHNYDKKHYYDRACSHANSALKRSYDLAKRVTLLWILADIYFCGKGSIRRDINKACLLFKEIARHKQYPESRKKALHFLGRIYDLIWRCSMSQCQSLPRIQDERVI